MSEKKVILISNCYSVVGSQIANILASRTHYRIAISGTEKQQLDLIVNELATRRSSETSRQDFLAIECGRLFGDKKTLSSESKKIKDQVLAHFGRLDVLINNASHQDSGCDILADRFYDDFDNTIRANLKVALHVTNQVRSELIQSQGMVINVACCTKQSTTTPNFGYSVSRAGLSMMTKVMANAFADLPGGGATVRVVGVELDQSHAREADNHEQSLRVIEKIADVIVFLIEGKSQFIHGTVIKVNG